MDQRTHTWIAIRAIALLEDEGRENNLVSLLRTNAIKASVGAWIPDEADAKRGGAGSRTDNHIFKIDVYKGPQVERFVCKKDELVQHLGTYRKTAQFLQNDRYLDANWWSTPYKGDVASPGQHLPNRAMAMSTMMKDLLIMGNKQVDSLIPGNIRFAQYLSPEVRTEEEASAMYFFMLSHFVADACMPCHCDARPLAGYSNGLHNEMEKSWSKSVGNYFDKKNMLKSTQGPISEGPVSEALERARQIDSKFDLDFRGVSIPNLLPKHDVWLELMYVCRASFALASIIAPCRQYEYSDPTARTTFKACLGVENEQVLRAVNQAVMYDAVLNTGIVMKHIWNRVSDLD